MNKAVSFIFFSLAAAAQAAPIHVECVAAGGFYGRVKVVEAGSAVRADVTWGLGLKTDDFLRKLQLAPAGGDLQHLSLTFPRQNCIVLPTDGTVIECVSNQVKAEVPVQNGSGTIGFTLDNANLLINQLHISTARGAYSAHQVRLTGTHTPAGAASLYTATEQVFRDYSSASPEGCHVR